MRIPLPAVGQAQMDRLLARAPETLPETDVTAACPHGQRLDDEAVIAWLKTEGAAVPIAMKAVRVPR